MRLRKPVTGVALTGALLVAVGGQAQPQSQNLERLKQMKVATTDLNIPVVPQTGKNADAIRENHNRPLVPDVPKRSFAVMASRAAFKQKRKPRRAGGVVFALREQSVQRASPRESESDLRLH